MAVRDGGESILGQALIGTIGHFVENLMPLMYVAWVNALIECLNSLII